MSPFAESLNCCLAAARLRAWRLHLETPGVEASVPLLRGVWGAALHDDDPALYRRLFEGQPGETPGYVLRPAPADAEPRPALEMILLGPPDPPAEAAVWAAWELALARGLGPRRIPARLIEARPLAWDGTALSPSRTQPGFALSPLPWPLAEGEPCRLAFVAPLRLLRHGRLTEAPTLADLTVAALRRLEVASPDRGEALRPHREEALRLAWAVPAGFWEGAPLDLVRYSGRQRGEIEMRGVAGGLYLPEGPGPLAPLFAAAAWLHLGKGTVMGMGQLEVRAASRT